MKMRLIWIVGLAAMLLMLPLLAGCGGGEDAASEAESAATAEQPATAEHPAGTEHPAKAATETAAMHDCAGDCGMKAVPEAQMTEVNGKWYCAGCAKKAAEG